MAKIGPRLWKTGLAVALTIVLLRLTGHPYEVYGAVAAALAVAPSASHSLRSAGTQIGAHLLGGLVGSLTVLIFGFHPLVAGATVVGVLLLCQQMNWRDVSASAVTVTLFVMAPHGDSAGAYAIWRLLAVVAGSLIGAGVNALVLPPNYWPATVQTALRAGERLDEFILTVVARLPEPQSYPKAEILAGAARVDELLKEARRLYLLLGDDERAPGRKAVAERSIKVLGSLLERIQVIHKAALNAGSAPDYPERVMEIQVALNNLVRLRRVLYQRLLAELPTEALTAELAVLEYRFETPAGLPGRSEEVESFFRLHEMRTSVAYMANRLTRLNVAMDGAAPAAPADCSHPVVQSLERLS